MDGVPLFPFHLPAVVRSNVVLIAEGEKDALSLQRAASGFPEHGGQSYAATTNVGGAGKWKDDYSAYLKGKKVFVFGDNDDAGRRHVQQVCASTSKYAQVVHLVDFPAQREHSDVSDYLEDHTPAQLCELMQAAPMWTAPADGKPVRSGIDSSPRFDVRDSGVFYLGRDRDGNHKPPLWLCGRLDIRAQTRDDKSREWGRFLTWQDNDHVPHSWAMPNELLQSDGVRVRSELARLGLAIAPGRNERELLLTYLQMWSVDQRARCVERLGWHGPVYVVPSETIGEENEHVVFQNTHALEPAFSTAGTTEEWRDHIATLARGNSRIVFAVCVALAGPLIEPAGEYSGGFHIRGSSSTGKSTALCMAASVSGSPSHYCRLWRATANGLEGMAALHNDGVLILDELGQVDPREAGEAAYMLANGLGKARAARDGTARASAKWRLLFLSAEKNRSRADGTSRTQDNRRTGDSPCRF